MIPSMGQGCHSASGFSVLSSTDSPGRKTDSMFMLVWEEKKIRQVQPSPFLYACLGSEPFLLCPSSLQDISQMPVRKQEIYQSTNTNCIFRFIRNKDDTMFRSLALEPFRFPSSSVRSSGEKEKCCLWGAPQIPTIINNHLYTRS